MKWMSGLLVALTVLPWGLCTVLWAAPASAQSASLSAALSAPLGGDSEARQAARDGVHGAPQFEAPHFEDTPILTPPPSFATTLGHAFAGYGVGLVSGAAVGTIVGGAMVIPLETILPAFAGLALGGIGIAPLGAALGAWGWSTAAGGTGSFWAALGLSYLGQGLGVAWYFALSQAKEWGLGIVGGLLLGAIASAFGAAIGYDLTMDAPAEEQEATGWLVVPYLAPAEHMDGAVVGAAGLF